MFQQNISTDDSIYYNHFQKRAMRRGEGWVEVPFLPRVGSVNGYVVRRRVLKNLRTKILEGKNKNFPK